MTFTEVNVTKDGTAFGKGNDQYGNFEFSISVNGETYEGHKKYDN
jgi:hypothetical protein